MSNGFDTTNDNTDITTWSRLNKTVKDDIQREFDPNVNRKQLEYEFNIN